MTATKRIIIALLLTIILFCPHYSASANQINVKISQNTNNINPVFQSIITILKNKVEIPVFLPSYIPDSDAPSHPVYAILESNTGSEYYITLSNTDNCEGGNYCRLGTVTGQKVTESTPVIEGQNLTLSDGTIAYFNDAECGANCTDSTLTWDKNNIRYTVGIKVGDVETLVKMANSMTRY